MEITTTTMEMAIMCPPSTVKMSRVFSMVREQPISILSEFSSFSQFHVQSMKADFEKGTLIINEPGKYKLCEDIVFDPIQDKALPVTEMYLPDFNIYDEKAYGLGFFAAIAISASDVEIYLNNFSIEQSAAHALMQRFFAIIELANSPFLQSVGPAQFVGEEGFQAASNVLIQGPGTLGRSAHHGVHGNENLNITIRNVTFQDFEVAAVGTLFLVVTQF